METDFFFAVNQRFTAEAASAREEEVEDVAECTKSHGKRLEKSELLGVVTRWLEKEAGVTVAEKSEVMVEGIAIAILPCIAYESGDE